jgi:thiol-disulfide isomerase/thioredoxin
MNHRQFASIAKYIRLPIVAIGILVIFLTIHLSSANLAPMNAATEPNIAGEITSLSPTSKPTPGIGWKITSTSGTAEIQLARYLSKKGAVMYGAYWCPHCYEQKQLFGKEAWAIVKQVECAEDAVKNPQPKVCQKAGIKGFPTWKINGKLDPGVKKLAQLSQMTGYKGNLNFKYDRLFDR